MRKAEKISLGDWTIDELIHAGLTEYKENKGDEHYFKDNKFKYVGLRRNNKIYEIVEIRTRK